MEHTSPTAPAAAPGGGGTGGYAGGAFHPTLPAGRASGRLTFGPLALRFEGPDGGVELPLNGLQLSLGGASDRLVFFRHPACPDTTFHTSDHAVLKDPVVVGTPALAAQLGGIRRKKAGALAVWLGILGFFLALVGGLFLAKDPLVNAVSRRIPVEWEIALGETVFEQIKKEKRLVQDQALRRQFDQLTEPLLRGIGDQRYPFQFHIVEDSTLNAFALPGGHVVVHSGLILAADTPEEVAGVLGHEIAHVTKRHSIRNLVKSAGLFFVLKFLLGDASDLIGVLTQNAAFLLNQKFSRDFEREADDAGWDYLVAARINPRGMITFFEKLEAKQAENPAGAVTEKLAFLSTHPATRERIDRLQAKLAATPAPAQPAAFGLSFPEFKNTLRNTLNAGTQ